MAVTFPNDSLPPSLFPNPELTRNDATGEAVADSAEGYMSNRAEPQTIEDRGAELNAALKRSRARSAEIEAEEDQLESGRKQPKPNIDHASDGGVI
ncbi:hypothetical protein [Phenylobacterium montanum]|uniref:Uncharacterized protein n=1 Tax=Phenylobacterium montanum TaxID=2823693 RepID=A0A975G2B5_9CAUL|nr:hypothetical protein [Caulobacter sp. S6]QUD89258.1 hypothetical protein KCG34_05100 [Caulobacter sp. S6]